MEAERMAFVGAMFVLSMFQAQAVSRWNPHLGLGLLQRKWYDAKHFRIPSWPA